MQFTEQSKGKQFLEKFQFFRKAFRTKHHLTHDMREYWRHQGDSALHYQQEKFETAAQAHMDGQRMKKYTLQLLLLHVVEQRK